MFKCEIPTNVAIMGMRLLRIANLHTELSKQDPNNVWCISGVDYKVR